LGGLEGKTSPEELAAAYKAMMIDIPRRSDSGITKKQ
jgi:hypothetical protein